MCVQQEVFHLDDNFYCQILLKVDLFLKETCLCFGGQVRLVKTLGASKASPLMVICLLALLREENLLGSSGRGLWSVSRVARKANLCLKPQFLMSPAVLFSLPHLLVVWILCTR